MSEVGRCSALWGVHADSPDQLQPRGERFFPGRLLPGAGSVSFLLPNMPAKGSTCIQIHCENYMQ